MQLAQSNSVCTDLLEQSPAHSLQVLELQNLFIKRRCLAEPILMPVRIFTKTHAIRDVILATNQTHAPFDIRCIADVSEQVLVGAVCPQSSMIDARILHDYQQVRTQCSVYSLCS